MGSEQSSVAKRESESKQVSKDYVYSKGNADAYVKDGTAISMAQSRTGAAYAWTDGRNYDFGIEGDGWAAVGQGIAVAGSGGSNVGAAYSSKAYDASRSLAGGPERKRIKEKRRRCGGSFLGCTCDNDCSCACSDCSCR